MTEESEPSLGAIATNGGSQSGHRALRRNLKVCRSTLLVHQDCQLRADPEERKSNPLFNKPIVQGHLQKLQVWQQMP